jgi:hypothetical protein
MSINRSKKQKVASRNNLRGHYGPKTINGKKISSLNGLRNYGIKSCKKRAKQLSSVNKIKDSLYSEAGCLYCEKACGYKSFSKRTVYTDLPIKCYENIIKVNPSNCFYYFFGYCGIVEKYNSELITTDYCFIKNNLLNIFSPSSVSLVNNNFYYRAEIEYIYRKKFLSKKKEFLVYFNKAKRSGFNTLVSQPRCKYIINFFKSIMNIGNDCTYKEPIGEIEDKIIDWIKFDFI